MIHTKKHSATVRSGFSLIEALIAISILVIVVVGAMALVVTTGKQVEFSTERVEATFLAQDAVEYVISKKQQNVIDSSSDWLFGFKDCLVSSCGVDSTDNGGIGNGNNKYVADMCGGSCDPLQYNENTKRFGYGSGSGWEETKYTRVVDLEKIGGDEARLTVTVSWESRETGQTEEFVLKTNIFNTKL
ncbi:MAG: prepilin-type N-terminal cleavage/methylation domain-containing protein [Candidatus Paceibacterota bacterium]